MATISRLAVLALLGAVAGCSSTGGGASAPTGTPGARAGLGAAGSPSLQVTLVDRANFESPSKNITCDLTTGSVRCEIVKRDWEPPTRPASCQLDWGRSMSIRDGRADFVCAGDTVVGTATFVLPYGSSVRAGSVQCDSGNAAMRCVDQKSQHGFTLAIRNYNLF